MATLASVVKKYQQQGQGRGGALASGTSDILKEMIDPRRFLFKSDGVMATLFPSLRAFKAKGAGEKGDLLSSGSSASTPILNEILINSEITAKNTAALPMMGRDMNVMRQGILKLVKLQGGTQRDKADRFFMSARDREALYESQFGKRAGKSSITPSKQDEKPNESVLTKILKGLGFLEIVRDLMPLLRIIGGVALPLMSAVFTSLLPLIVGAAAITALTQLFGDWKKGKEEKEDHAYLRKLKDEGKELTPAQQAQLDKFEKEDKSVTPGEATRKAAKGNMTLGTAKELLAASHLNDEELKKESGVSRKVLEEYVKRGGKTALRELSLEMGETPGGHTRAPKAEKGKAEAGQKRAEKVISETGNLQEVMDFFMQKGWSKEQAAGIAGNLKAESELKTDAIGDNGQAYGIAQWHPDRQAMFEQVYGKKLQQANLKEQLEFVDWELKNSEKRAGTLLSNAQTAADSAAIVDQYYERSSGAHRQKRIDIASSLVGGSMTAESVPPSSGKKVNNTSQDVAVAQRTEGNQTAPVIIDKSTTNNTQMAGNGNQNKGIASPYNEELFDMLFKMATS